MSKYIVRALTDIGISYEEDIWTEDLTKVVYFFSCKATMTSSDNTKRHRETFLESLVCINIDKVEEEYE